MSLQRLRTFTEVYRLRSISAASRALELSQPAVSQHIAGLEDAIGRPLFDRTTNGVIPTAAAHDLAADLGDRLDAAEIALVAARARSSELAGTIQIVGQSDFLAEFVTPYLLPLLDSGMLVRLRAAPKGDLEALLLDGKCDLGISGDIVTDRQLRSELLVRQRLIAVASPHVVTNFRKDGDVASELSALPFLTHRFEASLVEIWAKQQNIEMPTKAAAFVAHTLHAVRTLAVTGYGWTVLPQYLCQSYIAEGRLQAIPGLQDDPIISYFLVWAPTALRNARTANARQMLIRSFANMLN
ncbi:DNA-binding transcriptional regulator, LysR family [Sphingobium sp. YR657]|uniref:LysR family transcriptional regulator n=1 Tax=Sphingobium sp. YR657 TaxID=1884366 RepID=UPI000917BDD8|nr:LysR family transcriptional regulator [Sphingobium sp. YR657]SHM43822.1 DNA-binding transcriptional regulator, LysR family [Sphingobium sp. YR657]